MRDCVLPSRPNPGVLRPQSFVWSGFGFKSDCFCCILHVSVAFFILHRARALFLTLAASRKGFNLHVFCISQNHQSTSLLHRAKASVYKFAASCKGISLQVCCIAQRLQSRKAISLLCCIMQRHLSISLLYCTKASHFTFAVSCKAIVLQVCCIAQRLKYSRLLYCAKPSSLFWTFCQVSSSGFASGNFVLCNSSLVNLDNRTYYGVFNNSVIFEQYYGMLYPMHLMYFYFLRCALSREVNYCTLNIYFYLGPTTRFRVSNSVKQRSLIVLMLLMSGNVSPNPGPHIASNFTTPVELRSRSGLGFIDLNVRSLLPIAKQYELLALNLSMSKTLQLTLAGCYRPPSASSCVLHSIMDSLVSLNYKELIVMGDFNLNWTHSISDDFKLLCDSRNLFQLVDTPTRPNLKFPEKSTLIDLVFTNVPHKYYSVSVFANDVSDHCVVAVARDKKLPKQNLRIITRRFIKYLNELAFLYNLAHIDCDKIYFNSRCGLCLGLFS